MRTYVKRKSNGQHEVSNLFCAKPLQSCCRPFAQVWVCLPGKSGRDGEVRYEKPLHAMVACARRQKAKNANQKVLTTNRLERHDDDDDVYLDYYKRQMMLFVHLCYDRQYLAIDFLRGEDIAWAPMTIDLVNLCDSYHVL